MRLLVIAARQTYSMKKMSQAVLYEFSGLIRHLGATFALSLLAWRLISLSERIKFCTACSWKRTELICSF